MLLTCREMRSPRGWPLGVVELRRHREPARLAHLRRHLERRALPGRERLDADVGDRQPAAAARADLEQDVDGDGQVVAHGQDERGVAGGQAVGAVGGGEQGHPAAEAVQGGPERVRRRSRKPVGVGPPGDGRGAGDRGVVGLQRGVGVPDDGPGHVLPRPDGRDDVGHPGRVETGRLAGAGEVPAGRGGPGEQLVGRRRAAATAGRRCRPSSRRRPRARPRTSRGGATSTVCSVPAGACRVRTASSAR